MQSLPFLHHFAQSTAGKTLWNDIRTHNDFARLPEMPLADLRAQNMVSRIRGHFRDAANRDALIDFLQTVPVPPALADWHHDRMDALWTALMTDGDLFAAASRVMTDSLPATARTISATRKHDIMYIHDAVARIWDVPAPHIVFDTYASLSAYGLNRVQHRREGKQTRFVHTSYISDTDQHGKLRSGPAQMETAMHELGHSMEAWLVHRLLGASENNITPEQAIHYGANVGDDWELKSAATYLALNNSRFGAMEHGSNTDETTYRRYLGQLCERHVRWLAWQTTWILRAATADYPLANAISRGDTALLAAATNKVFEQYIDILPPFHPLHRSVNTGEYVDALANARQAKNPSSATAQVLHALHQDISKAEGTIRLSAYMSIALHDRLANDFKKAKTGIESLRDNLLVASSVRTGTACWNNYIAPLSNSDEAADFITAETDKNRKLDRRAAQRHLHICPLPHGCELRQT